MGKWKFGFVTYKYTAKIYLVGANNSIVYFVKDEEKSQNPISLPIAHVESSTELKS